MLMILIGCVWMMNLNNWSTWSFVMMVAVFLWYLKLEFYAIPLVLFKYHY